MTLLVDHIASNDEGLITYVLTADNVGRKEIRDYTNFEH